MGSESKPEKEKMMGFDVCTFDIINCKPCDVYLMTQCTNVKERDS